MYKKLIAILFVFACASVAFSQAKPVQLNVEKQELAEKLISGVENQSATALQADLVDKDKTIPAVKDKSNAPNKRAASDGYHKFEVSGGYSHNFTVCCLTSFYASEVDVQNFNAGVPVPGNSYTAILTSFDTRTRANFKGFETSATYNFSRYIGATVDFSGYYGSGEILLAGGRVTPSIGSRSLQIFGSSEDAPQRIYNYMAGVQIKNNSTGKKFKPFAHALFGVSKQSSIYPDSADARVRPIYFPNGGSKISDSGFTMAFGGGLDISVSKRIDIRVFKFDYNPVYLKNKLITGSDPAQFIVGATLKYGGTRQDNYRLGFGIVFH